MVKFSFFTLEELSSDNLKLMHVLNKLSDATKSDENKHLVRREVDFYLENLLCIVSAFDNEEFIGAAVVIRCLDNRTYEQLWDEESRLVVELGSNYVDPKYQKNGIGEEFMKIRLNHCEQRGYFPVSVTSSKIVHKIFAKINGVLLNEYPKYKDLCSRVRTCNCPKKQSYHNKNCEMKNKEVYGFRQFIEKA